MKKSIFTLLLAMLISIVAKAEVASGTCGDNLTWSLSDDYVLTISGEGAMTDFESSTTMPWYSYITQITNVVIESGVTSIGTYAFYGCTSLSSVTIPEGVTTIGSSCFRGCTSFSSITIPESVTSIGTYAFYGCTSLSSVSIPEGVTTISNSCFYGCTSLSSVSIPEGVSSIGDRTFQNCSALTNVTIPNSVTTIGTYAFRGCSSLESIIIPKGVTSIEPNTFYMCSSLASISIPEGVTTIGKSAFRGSSLLTTIIIPSSVTDIGSYAFAENPNLTEIICRAKTPPTCVISTFSNVSKSIPVLVPSECKSAYQAATVWNGFPIIQEAENILASGTCGDNLTWNYYEEGVLTIRGTGSMTNFDSSTSSVPWNSYLESIKSIIIEDGVTNIGDYAFCKCTNMSFVSIPSTITNIGSYVFNGCLSLTNLTIPNSVTSFSANALGGCTELVSVTLPFVGATGQEVCPGPRTLFGYVFDNSNVKGTVAINQYDYYNDGNLTYYIPSSLRNVTINGINEGCILWAGAFQGCNTLANIKLGEGVSSIGDLAFYNCTSLTSIAIPSSLTYIGLGSFSGCQKLSSLYIKDIESWCKIKFHNIYSHPFCYCSGKGTLYINEEKATDIVIPSTVTSIADNTFYKFSNITSVTIPNSVTSIGVNAFSDCSSLSSIIIPEEVASIGWGALQDCESLTSITLPGCSYGGPELESYNLYFGNIFGGDISIGESGVNYAMPNVPTSLRNVTLTSGNISTGEFYGCSALTNITLPEDISSIGDYAFYNCSDLSTLSFGNSLETIGNYAFYGCNSLSEFTLPATVKSIGDYSLENVSGMHTIKVLGTTPPALAATTSINNFSVIIVDEGAKADYIADEYWKAHQSQFMLSSDVTEYDVNVTARSTMSDLHMTIGEANLQKVLKLKVSGTINSYDLMIMRNKMTNLKELDLSDASIVANDYEYYSGCHSVENTLTLHALQPNLFSVKLPKTLTTINDRSLQDLTHVANIEIPANVTSIGVAAAKNLTLLKTLTIAEGSQLETIGDSAFFGCIAIKELSIPGSVKTMYSSDISFCDNLVKLTFEDGAESIDIIQDVKSMVGNKSMPLQEIYIGRDISTSYSKYYSPFYCKSSLSKVTFGSGVTAIPNYLLQNSACDVLVVPATLKTIGSDAFLSNTTKEIYITDVNAWSNISGLSTLMSTTCAKNIYLNGTKIETLDLTGVTTMQPYAFCRTTITGVNILKNSLVDIPTYAFAYTNVGKIILPATIATIGDYAFYSCPNFTELRLPSDIQSIGNHAFDGCSVLNDVYAYSVNPRPIDQNTFCTYKYATLHLPKCNYYDYYYDTQWSQFLKITDDITDPYESILVMEDKVLNTSTGIIEGEPDATITDGAGLVVEDGLQQSLGEVHLNFDGTSNLGSAMIGDKLHADKLYIDMDVTKDKWYYFCFPFDVTLSDIVKNGSYVFRYYDGEKRAAGENGWTNLPAGTTTLTAGKGYIFRTNSTGVLSILIAKSSASGEGINISDINSKTTLVTYDSDDADNQSWNFVGNKYLSYYNLNDLEYGAPIIIWNTETQQYEALRPGDDDYTLYPFQGFFVQTPEDVTEIGFDASDCETYTQSLDTESSSAKRRAKAARLHSNTKRYLINLTFSNGESTDKTRVVINEKQKLTFEAECDASKFAVTAGKPQIYSLDADGVKYSINERPLSDGKVKLVFQAPAKGEYTIGTTRMDMKAFLQDDETGELYDLSEEDYEFTSEAGTYANRFTLVIADDEATAIERLNATANAAGSENAYDINGRRVNGNQKGIVIKSGKKVLVK